MHTHIFKELRLRQHVVAHIIGVCLHVSVCVIVPDGCWHVFWLKVVCVCVCV